MTYKFRNQVHFYKKLGGVVIESTPMFVVIDYNDQYVYIDYWGGTILNLKNPPKRMTFPDMSNF